MNKQLKKYRRILTFKFISLLLICSVVTPGTFVIDGSTIQAKGRSYLSVNNTVYSPPLPFLSGNGLNRYSPESGLFSSMAVLYNSGLAAFISYTFASDSALVANRAGGQSEAPAVLFTPPVQRSNPRLRPINSTGGTDLYSRNFSWGTGLVSLPGRNGMDAGFGISYNSLVWIKEDSTVYFDPDNSNVSPGFRMGFPVIENMHVDPDTGKDTFIMVTPAGGKVEFRETSTPDVFETADGSCYKIKNQH